MFGVYAGIIFVYKSSGPANHDIAAKVAIRPFIPNFVGIS